ncbi:hypothetical protein M404DRAFT_826713 [Pisolithus tinctorius Marx 270]|uniref:Uncharacterized protein n=1 Tax=Pisolithus tinctorius Marx 270 TaxID=870435 RepID=A0A0C3NUM6_PISTI|nr:hypothetical protein M404DRAFT_826713 [Pisolithus tinctorius Marx 270]
MASGRIKKWLKSLGSDSHRSRQSDPSNLAPAATEATTAAILLVMRRIHAPLRLKLLRKQLRLLDQLTALIPRWLKNT